MEIKNRKGKKVTEIDVKQVKMLAEAGVSKSVIQKLTGRPHVVINRLLKVDDMSEYKALIKKHREKYEKKQDKDNEAELDAVEFIDVSDSNIVSILKDIRANLKEINANLKTLGDFIVKESAKEDLSKNKRFKIL